MRFTLHSLKCPDVRGSAQRNKALNWLGTNMRSTRMCGVVYFTGDDNTYHPELFDERRNMARGLGSFI
eukprot:TsM_000387800 transcript=TsM_000387800 gene=TsM_000387800